MRRWSCNIPRETYNLRVQVPRKEIPVYTVCNGAGERNLSFVRMPIDRGENGNAKNQDGQIALWYVEDDS